MRIALLGRAVLVLVILMTTGLGVAIEAASQVPEHIPWTADQPVTWQLFLSPYPQDGCMQAEAAAIHMTLNWSASYVLDYDRTRSNWYGYVDTSMINVTNTMEPFLSWASSQDKTPDVLNHEQRHFDLYEIYARKLKILLSRPRVTGPTKDGVRIALRKKINVTASVVLDMASQMQSLYDEETSHGTNADMQANWAAKIDAWLANPTQAP